MDDYGDASNPKGFSVEFRHKAAIDCLVALRGILGKITP
jgi:hypothetical protein